MKKTFLSALVIASATLLSCGGSGTNNNSDSTSSTMSSDSNASSMSSAAHDSGMNNMKDTGSKMMASTGPVSAMDKQFMMEVGAGGNTEIAASKVAMDRSSNDRVKAFANMMITDHTKAGDELKSIASAHSVTLPDSVMQKQHAELNNLRSVSAKSFDKAYINMMVKDHKETVDKFQMAAQKCDASDLKAFASKTLPTIKMHTDSASAMQKTL
ncbi:MAG: DUF4142 domain-containing protein [Bacteroidota bacterium]|nr:DUF4142 domain-containing protein [Bacteroidota bacterium]